MTTADDGDDRYLVVDGRRWRRTDPAIPEALRSELVKSLMAGRRAVKAGGTADDEHAVEAARRQVHAAKVALGERGEPWWETPSDDGMRERIAATCRALLSGRDPGSTICPSDVARVVGADSWRDRMPLVRDVATELADDGVVVVLQRGEAVDASASGPVRIGRGPAFDEPAP